MEHSKESYPMPHKRGPDAPQFLGRHVLAEFWECSNVDNPATVQNALVAAAEVTGVLILAESQMSIHS